MSENLKTSGAEDKKYSYSQRLAAISDNDAATERPDAVIGVPRVTVYPRNIVEDIIYSVNVEQFGAVADGVTDCTASIQNAIDYMSERGGGYVNFGCGMFRADGIILRKKIVLRGQGMRKTTIKARDGWKSRAVIETENFDDINSVPDSPGAYYSGCTGLTVHGNLQNYAITPSVDAGYGVLHYGSDQIFNDFSVIYAPGIGLRTEGGATSRDKFDQEEPDGGVPFIGQFQRIRIAKCGNDGWHFGGIADAFIEDVEIMHAGYGYMAADDPRSFMDPAERVACFRAWASVDIGKMHCYGTWAGYGFVAGTNTLLYTIRVKYDHLITESCLIGCYFKPKAVVQGALLDVHECSGGEPVHGSFKKTPVAIFAGTAQNCYFATVRLVQTTENYNGVHILVSGDRNTFGSIDAYRGFRADNLSGTAVWITGNNNQIVSGIINGYLGIDAEGNPSSGVVFAGGKNNCCDIQCGNGNVGFRLLSAGSITDGRLRALPGLIIQYDNFELLTDRYRARVALLSIGGHGNRDILYSEFLDMSDTDVKQIKFPVDMSLPYIPSRFELSTTYEILATHGRKDYPQFKFIRYDRATSTPEYLVFNYQMEAISEMDVRLAIKFN
ncbi:hypothetical protein C7M52_00441 [Mixta theicola]|nr:glycosyl hydrolase family 28-related protein [Mixta theicola]QHM74506.1 hypothetical protein C7M52_00441 [Mixta theicola]